MKDTKRALRRHHRRRMIARAHRSFRVMWRDDAEADRWARRHHDHMQVCSCYMCGHRRKWNGPTIQELRFDQRAKYASE